MSTIEITTSEFRQNQKKFFDLVASGVSVIVYRGKEIFQLSKDDTKRIFDKETEQMIKLAEEQYKSGDVTVCNTWDEVQKHLNEL